MTRVHETSFGRGDADGPLHASVRRNVLREERADHEQRSRARDRQRAVEVPPHGRRGAREIGVEQTLPDIDAYRDGNIDVVQAGSFEPGGWRKAGRADAPERVARAAFGVVHEFAGGVLHGGPPIAGGEGAQTIGSALHGGALRRKVAAARPRRAHVREQQALHLRREQQRRQDHALGKDLPRPGRHASSLHPPHIRMVRRTTLYPPTAPAMSIAPISVMSGRCDPPVKGSFRMKVSPGRGGGSSARTAPTDSASAPRWTGMWAACAIIAPSASNSAAEQSRRSRMFGDSAEWIRTSPISSATAAKAWPITSSPTASSVIPAPPPRLRTRAPRPATPVHQPPCRPARRESPGPPA